MQEGINVYAFIAVYRFLSPIAGNIAVAITPQYLAVLCYKVAAVLGLMQIHLPKDKHHWIEFAVSFQ